MKILIIEDDRRIAQFLEKGLKEEGNVTHWVDNGADGYSNASEQTWDLIIMDRMLPKGDGLTVCKKIRNDGNQVPILILSGQGDTAHRVEGLNAGADDYLPKPFAFSELLARIRAISRRKSDDSNPLLTAGDLQLDPVSHRVSYRDKKIDLTSREFALLRFFMRRQGHVLSRTVIAETVWEHDFQSGTNVIDVYVNYLRTKLKKVSGRDMIETIRGRGYVFGEPSE